MLFCVFCLWRKLQNWWLGPWGGSGSVSKLLVSGLGLLQCLKKATFVIQCDRVYPPVNQHKYWKSPCLKGKLTINCHVQWLCQITRGHIIVVNSSQFFKKLEPNATRSMWGLVLDGSVLISNATRSTWGWFSLGSVYLRLQTPGNFRQIIRRFHKWGYPNSWTVYH